MHPLWLTFRDRAVEEAWKADAAREILGYLRPSLLVLTLFFAAFGVVDSFLFPTHVYVLLALRFGVVVPALLGAWWFLSTPSGQKRASTHIQELLLALAVLMCGVMLTFGWVLLPDISAQGVWFAILAFELAMMVVYGTSRMRFVYAVTVAVATTVPALLLLGTSEVGPPLVLILPFGVALNLGGAWMTRTLELLARRAFAERAELEVARARSEALLHNALPAAIADQLHGEGETRRLLAASHEDVTVVLVDVVGFTPLCTQLPPEQIAALLDGLFSDFDVLCEHHGVEKVKTLGDAWLGAAGVPASRSDHAEAAARFALDLRAAAVDGPALRIGLATGHAVAGVIGRTRFAYDLWGEAVDAATAMQQASEPGAIRVTAALAERLADGFVVAQDGEARWLLRPR
jgi:class 3 adenylate cyclase